MVLKSAASLLFALSEWFSAVFMDFLLGIAVDDAVDDLHLVANAKGRCRRLRNHANRAVVEAHGDLIGLGVPQLLLGLVAEHRAADRADHRRDFPAVTVADLVA